MTTVEARVVDHVPTRASVNDVDLTESAMVEAALQREEEEKIDLVDDEEIDSCEGEDIEERMLTVALVQSVVEAGSPKQKQAALEPRYGLRKRRRPGCSPQDESSEEQKVLSAKHVDGGPITLNAATVTNKETSQYERRGLKKNPRTEPPGVKDSSQFPGGNYQQQGIAEAKGTKIKGISKLGEQNGTNISQGKEPMTPTEENETQPAPRANVTVKQSTQPGGVSALSTSAVTAKTNKSASNRNRKQPASRQRAQKPKGAPRSTKVRSSRAAEFTSAPSVDVLVPTSGAVPNPLLASPSHEYSTVNGASVAPEQATSSVPCPLQPSVPCPLQPECSDVAVDKNVTFSEPPVVSRPRVFSVDLDPSTFDFTDISGSQTDSGNQGTEAVDPAVVTSTDELTIFKRDRAFSFEFFSFVGDELLPAPAPGPDSDDLRDPSAVEEPVFTTRPRGDSIIFDPVSFQDGGIHEKNALMKVNAAKNSDTAPQGLLADAGLVAPTTPVEESSESQAIDSDQLPDFQDPVAPLSASSGEIATLPSGLTSGTSNGTTPATFEMELLNKDGRIGIYLPDARKARIARFHAKRKMRIWRKRIKYDCRKKLADSRPRIKGRFVKRADMDD